MLFIVVEVFSLEWVGSESRPLLHVEVIVFEETALFDWACKDENVSLPLYEILMPEGTKTLRYNKALACKSRGFAHKKKVRFLTHLLLSFSIKTAATYSPTFRQYHRRDGA